MSVKDPTLCVRCRGRGLCGLTYCPLIIRSKVLSSIGRFQDRRYVYGSSPPSVFISWVGYPLVNASIALPPIRGDTSSYDTSEVWIKYSLSDFLAMRLSLVRGVNRVRIDDLSSKFVELLQEVGLSERPVDTEVIFSKPLRIKPQVDDLTPPIGPGGYVKHVRLGGNPYFGRYLSKVYYDTDMRAVDAVRYLYTSGVPVSRIVRALSIGALGIGRYRRLVPTRWAITAVDKALSDMLVSKIKEFSPINEVQVLIRQYMKNLFVAVLIPSDTWCFEWLEAWFPGSTWNRFSSSVVIEGDWEGPQGRSSYPEIGGCYYASRLAVAEYLFSIRRKACVVLFREIYEGFDIPVGVWFVRENLRLMFRSSRPIVLKELNELPRILSRYTRISPHVWIRRSRLLSRFLSSYDLKRWYSG